MRPQQRCGETLLAPRARSSVPETSPVQNVQARRAFGYVLMSAVLPGSVQSFAGNRSLGVSRPEGLAVLPCWWSCCS